MARLLWSGYHFSSLLFCLLVHVSSAVLMLSGCVANFLSPRRPCFDAFVSELNLTDVVLKPSNVFACINKKGEQETPTVESAL